MNESTELPWIIWLKGDEPYFGEFTLDAEMVMQQLGIKRSRLTQISGKELRVGKARLDRYVRPLYRQADVSEYLAWTKPTTTSKRSSEFIEIATAELMKTSEQLEASLSEPLSESLHRIGEVGLLVEKEFSLFEHKVRDLVKKELSDTTREILLSMENLNLEIEKNKEKLQQIPEIKKILSESLMIQKELFQQISLLKAQGLAIEQSLGEKIAQEKTEMIERWDTKIDELMLNYNAQVPIEDNIGESRVLNTKFLRRARALPSRKSKRVFLD